MIDAPWRARAVLASGWRTARRAGAPGGRSRRREVAAYVLSCIIVGVPVSLLAGLALPPDQALAARQALSVLMALPMPALLARRYHDRGLSGAWVLVPAAVFVLWAARAAIAAVLGIEARVRFDQLAWPLDEAALIANLVWIGLALLPASAGANRFGPDPRAGA